MSETKIRPQMLYIIGNNGRPVSVEYYSRSMRMFQCSNPTIQSFLLEPTLLAYYTISNKAAPQRVNTDIFTNVETVALTTISFLKFYWDFTH